MKKFLLLGVSLVLMVSCLVMGISANGGLVAGAGMGTDHKVNNVEELANVLNFLMATNNNGKNNLGIDAEGRNISLVSSDGEKYPVTSLSSKKANNKYNSATVSLLTTVSSSTSCSHPEYSNGIKSSSQSLTREMTIYISNDTSFYNSKGNLRSSTTKEKRERQEHTYWENGYPRTEYYYDTSEETYTTVMDFDMQLVRVGNKNAYVNFKEFSYINENESYQIKYSNIDKWIEMPYEILAGLVDIDTQNRDVLKSFGDILEHLIDAGEIQLDDTFVSLNTDSFIRALEELSGSTPVDQTVLDQGDITFSYDLTSPTTPYMSLLYYYDISDSQEAKDSYNHSTNYVTTSSKMNLSEQYTIRNINNTIIPFDKDEVSVKVKTEKGFEKLFNIKERNKNDD